MSGFLFSTLTDKKRGAKPHAQKCVNSEPRWVPAQEVVHIQGYAIAGGLFYLGRRGLDESMKTFAVDPDLPVRYGCLPPEGRDCSIYDWPPTQYVHMHRGARGGYLAWLAGGRCEQGADAEYISTFFSGLEHRFFVDDKNDPISLEERVEIIREVKRLMKVFSGGSFEPQCDEFLGAVWALYSKKYDIPKYIELNTDMYVELFRLILAKQIVAKKPVPAKMAYQWTLLATGNSHTIFKYFYDEKMQELFAAYYEESFGEGLVIKPNKKRLKLFYSPLNPYLQEEIRLDAGHLPDPFFLRSPMGKLSPLWLTCVDALKPYNHYVRGSKEGRAESLRALVLLPKELVLDTAWAKAVIPRLQAHAGDDSNPLSVKQVYELLEKPLPIPLNKLQTTALCTLLGRLGFGCVPDPRFYKKKIRLEGLLHLFVGGYEGNVAPSAAFEMTAETVVFGALVAQTCGKTDASRNVLRCYIHTRHSDSTERNYLLAWSRWCLSTPQSMSGNRIKKLADVSQESRATLCHMAVSMVRLLSQSIAPEGIKKLQKIYKNVDLDENQILMDMHRSVSQEEPVMIMQRDPAHMFAIPRPNKAATSTEFHLNAGLIRQRKQETAAVKGVLQDIFVYDEESKQQLKETSAIASLEKEQGLDAPHQQLIKQLITQEQWSRGEIDTKCRALNLMTDGALEVLNEWSMRQVDALIVHNGDPVCVDMEIAQETLNHDRT